MWLFFRVTEQQLQWNIFIGEIQLAKSLKQLKYNILICFYSLHSNVQRRVLSCLSDGRPVRLGG